MGVPLPTAGSGGGAATAHSVISFPFSHHFCPEGSSSNKLQTDLRVPKDAQQKKGFKSDQGMALSLLVFRLVAALFFTTAAASRTPFYQSAHKHCPTQATHWIHRASTLTPVGINVEQWLPSGLSGESYIMVASVVEFSAAWHALVEAAGRRRDHWRNSH